MGKPKHNKNIDKVPGNEKVRISEMLKEELDFNENQISKFFELRENHHANIEKINKELMLTKKQMFDKAINSDSEVISDSLLNISLKKQAELEKVTFQHFLKLKKICTPEQRDKLFKIMKRLFGPLPQGPPAPSGARGGIRDDIPPPPHGDRPPRRD